MGHARSAERAAAAGDGWELYRGDALEVLPRLRDAGTTFEAVITDPPYASGGLYAGARRADPREKYQHHGVARGFATFSGDARDQRSWTCWSMLWLSRCRELLPVGGYCLTFVDWRQLPAMTDAFQAAGLVWRGVIAWDKGRGARAPHKGYFRHQAEYIVWGTRGPCAVAKHGGPWDGVIRAPVRQTDKYHLTGKPTALLAELVECVPAGAYILDPFAGSATTGVAAIAAGRRFVGVEISPEYLEIGASRLRGVRPPGTAAAA